MTAQEVKRKPSAVLAASIVLAGILFCPMAMAAPSLPKDVQMVEPDSSLPKEIATFWGKWEGFDRYQEHFVIIEKIDREKASIYRWKSGYSFVPAGWDRLEAQVIKEYGKYKLWFRYSGGGTGGAFEYTLNGKYMDCYYSTVVEGAYRLTRVP
jgi:hypothetical protein